MISLSQSIYAGSSSPRLTLPRDLVVAFLFYGSAIMDGKAIAIVLAKHDLCDSGLWLLPAHPTGVCHHAASRAAATLYRGR